MVDSVKRFKFEGYDDLRINEVLEENFGLYVWPSAQLIADYVYLNRKKLCKSRVLEVGAGTALPGILCGVLGVKVCISDAFYVKGEKVYENVMKSLFIKILFSVNFLFRAFLLTVFL